jgi:hypothetical protein
MREGPFQGGLTLSIQGTSARLRMDAPGLSSKETIRDFCLGGGVFVELHPAPAFFAGLSARGFSSLRRPTESATGDFRGYLGLQWGILRLEGGYRVWIHDLDAPDEGLYYLLYGPYVAAGLTFRF